MRPRSTPAIRAAILEAIDKAGLRELPSDYLDVGSGEGELLNFISARYTHFRCFACDYTSTLMRLADQTVNIVDLNRDPLPYADNRFALVTCVETIEHLENYRATLREIFRVLRPGGLAVISTPNILNLRSRLRYLAFGFPSLFGPLPVGEQELHSSAGHISPVSWFHLAHALLNAGFVDLELSTDKFQRRSVISFILLYLPIRTAGWFHYRRELSKFRTIGAKNDAIVRQINSGTILLGRTLVVSAHKPGRFSESP
jgi:SAM-dependent methyltransferase